MTSWSLGSTWAASGRTRRGLRELFNVTSDNNLAQLMDIVIGLVKNEDARIHCKETIVPEKKVTIFCGHRDSRNLQEVVLDDPDLQEKINLTKPIFFLIHGWTDNGTKLWEQGIADNVVQFMDQNACVVSWARLADYEYTVSAIKHVPIVAEYLTKFVRFINRNGIPLSSFTLAGHSLGAHISGQVGRSFNGLLGAIYGMDPAQALFTAPFDRGFPLRLDRSDAKYVQMIITSRGQAGVLNGDGHENFYPNGGTLPQPNCLAPLSSDAEFADQLLCSHLHSTLLFRNSIDPKIVFLARQCSDWMMYLAKKCDMKKSNKMGPYSSRIGGDFYMRTSAVAPFNV
ncbi:lipase member I [Culex quinquefasciatus]|uniref:Lipase member I n=1 Tax=Culex quinquefasciatus TaxID=7176 RepID=B0WH81_CULQU|nr:lipase member I [Culex quinquefasciatus]|eukprot:XP_001848046.1 lipase member I [Culex quinquefasciatus]